MHLDKKKLKERVHLTIDILTILIMELSINLRKKRLNILVNL
jgi:hypothetical protein